MKTITFINNVIRSKKISLINNKERLIMAYGEDENTPLLREEAAESAAPVARVQAAPIADWTQAIPDIKRPDNNHPLWRLARSAADINNALIWRPGKDVAAGQPQLTHMDMERNIAGMAAAGVASVFNAGNQVSVGEVGVSIDNGQLVLIGQGKTPLYGANHRFIGTVKVGQPAEPANPYIIIENQVMVAYVKAGEIAIVRVNGEFQRLTAGRHVITGLNPQYVKSVKLTDEILDLEGGVNVVTVPDGKLGFMKDKDGKLHPLETGQRHIIISPAKFEAYQDDINFADLQESVIVKKPYLRMVARGNMVHLFSEGNALRWMDSEDKPIERTDSNLVYIGSLSKDVVLTSEIRPVTDAAAAKKSISAPFTTQNNVPVSIDFDVRYAVQNVDKLFARLNIGPCLKGEMSLEQIIDHMVREIATAAMNTVMSHHNSNDMTGLAVNASSNRASSSKSPHESSDVTQECISALKGILDTYGIVLQEPQGLTLQSGIKILDPKARETVESIVKASAEQQLQLMHQKGKQVENQTEQARARALAETAAMETTTQAEADNRVKLSNLTAQLEIQRKEAETKQSIEVDNARAKAAAIIAEANARAEATQIQAKAENEALAGRLAILTQFLGPENTARLMLMEAQTKLPIQMPNVTHLTQLTGNPGNYGMYGAMPMQPTPYMLSSGGQYIVPQALPSQASQNVVSEAQRNEGPR
jgi:hypothetical protein